MTWAVIGAYTPLFKTDDASITTVLAALAMTVIGALIAFGFYRLRGQHPFCYGCIDIAVGLIVLFFTFVPLSHYAVWTPQSLAERGMAKLLGVAAGIYIIVRGLDNMERRLPRSWRRRWYTIFPKQKSDAA
jgi:uncharacterized membrane protein YgaE (UPF0421/DUF939 family)